MSVDFPAPRDSTPPAVLHPSGSVRLLHPLGSSSVLSRSSSAADLRISSSASVARALVSTLAPQILGIPLARWLSIAASGSSTICSTAIGQPPGVGGGGSMAPVGSTMGHHNGCGLGPARLLLFRLPPVSSLAPPSFITALDSVCLLPPPRWKCYGAGRAFREGGVMSRPWTVLLCFCSPCVPPQSN